MDAYAERIRVEQMTQGALMATAVNEPGKLTQLFNREAEIDEDVAALRWWEGHEMPE